MRNSLQKGRHLLAREFLNRGCDYYEKGDAEKAMVEFLQAGRLGSPEAQLNLGNMYSSGELGFIDKKKAVYNYKKAIKQGNPEAAVNLAITYKEMDQKKWYVFWMRHAASLGEPDAIKMIAKITKNGDSR